MKGNYIETVIATFNWDLQSQQKSSTDKYVTIFRTYQVEFFFYLFLNTGEDQLRFTDNLVVIRDVLFFQQQFNEKSLKTPLPQSGSFCSAGCSKTYVRLSGTGRNSVRTCEPLTFIRKKYRNSWRLTLNYSRVKMYLIVIKAKLIFDKITLNNPFKFAIPHPFYLFLRAPFGVWTWQNVLDKNSWVSTTKLNIVLVRGTNR